MALKKSLSSAKEWFYLKKHILRIKINFGKIKGYIFAAG